MSSKLAISDSVYSCGEVSGSILEVVSSIVMTTAHVPIMII